MKALTIYQPWASLVIAGAKPYEFRGWNPRHRGPSYAELIGQRIGIHASARLIGRTEIIDMMSRLDDPDEAPATCLHPALAMPVLEAALAMTMPGADGSLSLPLSAIIGTAVLGEPRNGIEIAEEIGVPRTNDSDRDAHANWGWPMLDIEPFSEPVPARGAQGFWNWTTAESAAEMFA